MALEEEFTRPEQEQTGEEIRRLDEELERRVAERTAELQAANDELRRQIAERERIEQDLRESEKRLHLITDHMQDVATQANPHGVRGYVSPSARVALGYEPEELLGKSFLELIHPEDLPIARAAIQLARKTGSPGKAELRYRHGDGRYICLEVVGTTLFDERGEVLGAVYNSRDVTDRKRAEAALQESEERFRSVVLTAREAVVCLDSQGTIVLWNRGAEAILGYSSEEVVGKSGAVVLPKRLRDRYMEGIQQIAALRAEPSEIEKPIETLGLRKDGSEVPLEVTLAPWTSGEKPFFTVIARDITERKQLQLLRAQRLETAGQVAGQVAHDFNNLLSPMVAYPELIKMQLPSDHPAVPLCDAMLAAAHQMAEINTEMLALSRRGLLHEEATDLNQLVKQAVAQTGDVPHTP